MTKYIKKEIERALDKLLRFKCIRKVIGKILNKSERFLEHVYYPYGGFKFHTSDQLFTIAEVVNDYRFDDIRESDIVLDIGAHIGAFSIFASKKARHVYAVEPLYADIIRKNISINGINNISVIETGLGIGKQSIKFGRQKVIELTPLDKILEITGKCDFLKMDCEGGEWCIKTPQELDEFRRIECEIHNFDGKHPFSLFESLLGDAGFEYESKKTSKKTCLIHAKKIDNKNKNKEKHIANNVINQRI